jgi:hypothetical protein
MIQNSQCLWNAFGVMMCPNKKVTSPVTTKEHFHDIQTTFYLQRIFTAENHKPIFFYSHESFVSFPSTEYITLELQDDYPYKGEKKVKVYYFSKDDETLQEITYDNIHIRTLENKMTVVTFKTNVDKTNIKMVAMVSSNPMKPTSRLYYYNELINTLRSDNSETEDGSVMNCGEKCIYKRKTETNPQRYECPYEDSYSGCPFYTLDTSRTDVKIITNTQMQKNG